MKRIRFTEEPIINVVREVYPSFIRFLGHNSVLPDQTLAPHLAAFRR
jgi:hypothetical protein